MDLLRFSTAGSVDDGKSTLIGRLLYDSKGVFEDQLEAVQRSSVNRSAGPIDLSLLTDGLRAEREQGITIDVAYRYFATPKRKFIIADTPGHEQYTRNMATGASTASLSIILIDARHGALVQSRRHTYIASLLGIPHLVVAVNKMDLVDYSQARFEEIRKDFSAFLAKLGVPAPVFVPLSALNGDNVVTRSDAMPWYSGPSLLEHLESVDVLADENLSALRFPVQYVLRPNLDFRGFSGQISAGTIRVGEEVVALPAGTRSKVKRIHTYDGDLAEASAPRSVTVLLEDEVDISRGDMIVHVSDLPMVRRDFDAHVVWMDGQPLEVDRPYLVKHTTRTARCRIARIHHRVDVNTLEEHPAQALHLNEIARVRISAAQPLYLDAYPEFRRTGCFILVDPLTNATVAAGMVAADQPSDSEALASLPRVDRAAREAQAGHQAGVVWLTAGQGLDRPAVARALEARLFHRGVHAVVVDDQTIRAVLPPAGASAGEKAEGWRRVGELLGVLVKAGLLVIADIDAPRRQDRETVRITLGAQDFHEALLLHPRVAAGQPVAAGLLEAPILPDVEVVVDPAGMDATVAKLVTWLGDRGLFGAPRVVSPGAGI